MTKNDSENWNHRDEKRGWIFFQPHFFNLILNENQRAN